ncbi:hypothetical protein KCP78_10160 [Salmonella enterica subsp. enterica]|nr:hypothetical protein KCP78_10160 [Salmonella enterica subsp. enterica]
MAATSIMPERKPHRTIKSPQASRASRRRGFTVNRTVLMRFVGRIFLPEISAYSFAIPGFILLVGSFCR